MVSLFYRMYHTLFIDRTGLFYFADTYIYSNLCIHKFYWLNIPSQMYNNTMQLRVILI